MSIGKHANILLNELRILITSYDRLSAAILISQSTRSVSDGEHTFPGMLVVWKWLGRVEDALANGCEYVKSSIDARESGMLAADSMDSAYYS